MDFLFNPMTFIALAILMFSAILHEIAHGFVADRLGDPTARILGRLTLNPLPHIDLYMTILLPLFMYIVSQGTFVFGGAKPVPVDPYNLKDGRKDLALVSLAGPLTNLALAAIAAALIHLFFPQVFLRPSDLSDMFLFNLPHAILMEIVHINVLLAIFNLLPIPPLDGSKLFAMLLPEKDAHTYLSIGNMGMLLLIFLLQVPIGPFSLQQFIFRIYVFTLGLLGF
jgi:Zn-dependent protease